MHIFHATAAHVTAMVPAEGASGKSNLSGGWNNLQSKVFGSFTNLQTLMTMAGIILSVLAIGKYIWDKRRGGGGNTTGLIWSLVIAGLLAAPGLLIPLFLKLVDGFINFMGSLLK